MKVKLCVNTLHFSFSAVPNGKSLNLRIGVIELHVTLQRPTVFSASPSMDRSKIKLQLWQLFKLFVTLQNNVKCMRNSTLNNFSSFVITFCFCKMSNTRIIIMSTGLNLTDSKCFDREALCSEFSLCFSLSDSF